VNQDRLREVLDYDPETGIFTWRVRVSTHCYPGDVAGYVCPQRGYVFIGLDRCLYPAHRLAWFYVHGEWPENEIDHRNGVRADNRLLNLRLATSAQNKQNCRKARGVTPWRNKWKAQIGLGNKVTKYLGLFDTEEEAHQAYLMAKVEMHQFFAEGGE
jgi:HNH endonuclease